MEFDFNNLFKYAKQEIESSSRIERFSFRDRYTHSLRVLKWAKRIHLEEGGDWEVIKIACIFHDVGWDSDINHSIISKSIAEKYLLKQNYDKNKLVLILEAIENHNYRNDENQVGIESKIVMDADLLDEVGATSIVWDSMATQIEGNKDYYDVLERIRYYYGRLERNLLLLKTETGKRLYKERLEFITQFIDELDYELN